MITILHNAIINIMVFSSKTTYKFMFLNIKII